MALHTIFEFIPANSSAVHRVRYDDVNDIIQVYNQSNESVYLPDQNFDETEGAIYTAAGINFIQINAFPFAKKDKAPTPITPLNLTLVSKTDVTVNGGNNGLIVVSASGGNPFSNAKYDFNINAGPYTRDRTVFQNLSAGTYVIGVKDFSGNTNTLQVTIMQPGVVIPDVPTYGCKDPNASNYDPDADINDASLCEYPAAVLTEVKRIEVRPCPADGVMLRWISNLGNPDCWMFSGKIDNLITSVTSGDYEQAFGFKATIRKHLQPSVLLNTSGLDYNRFMAVSQVFSSQHVVMEDAEGNQTRVFVEPSGELGMREPTRRLYTMQVKVSLYPINAPN